MSEAVLDIASASAGAQRTAITGALDDEAAVQARLEARLIEVGALGRIQLAYARQRQAVTGERLSQTVLRLGLVSESCMALAIADTRGLQYVTPEAIPVPTSEALALFRREWCLANGVLPLAVSGAQVDVLAGDVEFDRIRSVIERKVGLAPRYVISDPQQVKKSIEAAFGNPAEAVRRAFEIEHRKLREDLQSALPTEEFVRQLLALSLAERATDVHLHPEPRAVHLSFRIDGVLQPVIALDRGFARMTSAIKVMAGMDISDTMRPQDGRFSLVVAEFNLDVRVSTSITPDGESVVMRLLPKGQFVSGLEELGFIPAHLPLLAGLFEEPQGILLMTGPTGSGKTTTLYAGLKPHGLSGKSILTVEDPIEYNLPAAIQTQVNRKAGYTFDAAIRHFLRHDPDIMLVGEIRDEETAQAASRAAETGHLVLSTLHANTAFGVPGRLGALGVGSQAIADNLIGVISQRLARRICPHCIEQETRPRFSGVEVAQRFGVERSYVGKGCAACRGTGYFGRLPIYELLVRDRQVAHWIEAGARRSEISSVLGPGNHVPMREVASMRLSAGETSVEECLRLFGSVELQAEDRV